MKPKDKDMSDEDTSHGIALKYIELFIENYPNKKWAWTMMEDIRKDIDNLVNKKLEEQKGEISALKDEIKDLEIWKKHAIFSLQNWDKVREFTYDNNLAEVGGNIPNAVLKKLKTYKEALEFYADPDNYFHDEESTILGTAYEGKKLANRAKDALK